MPERQRYRLNTRQVVAEAIDRDSAGDGEAIIVNLGTGTYYSIKGDGILLWNAIVAGAAVEEIVEAVSDRTGVTGDRAAAAIATFTELLKREGLIVEHVDETASQVVDLSGGGCGLLEPRLEIYTDMQDLILLDPVHEVDDRGWPHVNVTT